jgi:hypothetical protein
LAASLGGMWVYYMVALPFQAAAHTLLGGTVAIG